MSSTGSTLFAPVAQRATGGLRRAILLICCVFTLLGVLTSAPSVARATPLPTRAMESMFDLLALADVPRDLYGQPIADIRFEGNRRVESEAMLLELDSSVGELVTMRKLGNDLRRLWGLGKFSDVSVKGEMSAAGVVLTYIVKERPTIRKIVVEGNDKKKLDDIN